MTAQPKRAAVLLPTMGGGGAERVALGLIRNLVARGQTVDLVLVEAVGELLPLVPPEVKIVDLGASRYLTSLVPLIRYLRRSRPDSLHIVMWPLTIIGILAHRLARSKARLMVSDQVALSKHVGTGRLGARALRWTTRLFYPLADVRVVCSGDAADDLASVSGIPRAQFEIIFNPIEPPAQVTRSAEVEALWGDADGRIITVGTLKAQKNHLLLIEAFALVRRRRAAKLMILGEGGLRGVIEERARALGVADHVIMPGFAVDPWPYFASADLFALSSDYEGFPLVLVEALAAGLRAVSTDCPTGPREILSEDTPGRLVPCNDAPALADAIVEVLNEPAAPERARARAEQLSGKAGIDRYANLMLAEGSVGAR